MNAPFTTADRAIAASLDPCDARDVRLYAYSRRTTSPGWQVAKIDKPLPIIAMSTVLNQTEHFSTLLTAGFAETGGNALSSYGPDEIAQMQAGDSEYDYECDSDLDEVEGEDDGSTASPAASDHTSNLKGKQKDAAGVGSSPPVKYTILIPNIAFKTLRACVFYLYTGKVHFLPLSSAPSAEGGIQRDHMVSVARKSGLPACSPKSLYRLADAYGLKDLQVAALNGIISYLSPENLVQECFSVFFSMYDEPRQRAMIKLRKLYDHPKVQEALPGVMSKLVAGELPYATAALQELVTIRAGRTVRFVEPQAASSFSAILQEKFAAAAEPPVTSESEAYPDAHSRTPTPPSSSSWASFKRARNNSPPSPYRGGFDEWGVPGLSMDHHHRHDMSGPSSGRW
ncbi:uncharacterized protein TRAVEDRAFT_19359 [Trametes versicolor FP-101664 SS1]|uniref:uncharacterized protein n=1 Tax=Trametes versicolor (strain FP-101664) TaxID=717944 RepID=UPI0004623B01|nr:uncharacterized protein TRAVEDRAFT_19359 [Trametes versicolor FP-101664 SS1]EIW60772.1 hypothetical protein TRAVEDRAFT_19359 [Trametes versicolor FP-101664 SS1]